MTADGKSSFCFDSVIVILGASGAHRLPFGLLGKIQNIRQHLQDLAQCIYDPYQEIQECVAAFRIFIFFGMIQLMAK